MYVQQNLYSRVPFYALTNKQQRCQVAFLSVRLLFCPLIRFSAQMPNTTRGQALLLPQGPTLSAPNQDYPPDTSHRLKPDLWTVRHLNNSVYSYVEGESPDSRSACVCKQQTSFVHWLSSNELYFQATNLLHNEYGVWPFLPLQCLKSSYVKMGWDLS